MRFLSSRVTAVALGFIAGVVVTRMLMKSSIERAKRQDGVDEPEEGPLTRGATSFMHEANRVVTRLAEDIDDIVAGARIGLPR